MTEFFATTPYPSFPKEGTTLRVRLKRIAGNPIAEIPRRSFIQGI